MRRAHAPVYPYARFASVAGTADKQSQKHHNGITIRTN